MRRARPPRRTRRQHRPHLGGPWHRKSFPWLRFYRRPPVGHPACSSAPLRWAERG